jgi:TetR/AcrR family transcriptional regulator, transcriptional repressor of aconitase
MPKVTEEYLDLQRGQIIDAAYRCFARKGFHQASMRDIYAEAGLSPGAVYHYFDSKADIIEASFIFDQQRSLPVLESAMDDPDPMKAIDHLIDYFYAGLESAAELGANRVNIQGWGEALVNPRLSAPWLASLLAFREKLSRLIRGGQAAGVIDARIDPRAAGEVILSTYLGLYLQKAFIPDLDVGRYKAVILALLHGDFATEGA